MFLDHSAKKIDILLNILWVQLSKNSQQKQSFFYFSVKQLVNFSKNSKDTRPT